MRVDVDLEPAALEAELDALHERLRDGGEAFAPVVGTLPQPGLVLRRREADGVSFVYVEDTLRGALAGCVVFNRLIEVDRRTDRYVRSPHTRLRPDYQRRGVASLIYARELDAGWCLVSGARQSSGAHALWLSLAGRYRLGYVALRNKALVCLGSKVEAAVLDDLVTRLVLTGPRAVGQPLSRAQGRAQGRAHGHAQGHDQGHAHGPTARLPSGRSSSFLRCR